MSTGSMRAAGFLFVLTLFSAQARSDPELSVANFVDVGDAVADILDTSGLAFATMVIGATSEPLPTVRRAAFRPRSPQAFESPCPGGGRLKGSVLDADASGDVSSGDRFVTLFESCVLEGSTVTGRSEFVVQAHRHEGAVEITELDFRFKDLGTPALRWTGPARVQLRTDLERGTEHYVVEYRNLAVSRGHIGMRWSFSLDMARPPIGDQIASVQGSLVLGDLRVRLRQDEPYVIPADGFARAGQLTATDEHGARVQVEAGPRRYTYRLYLAGNDGELPDSVSQSKLHGRP